MDYQYYDEESDYIDVDEEELAAAGGLDYGYGYKPQDADEEEEEEDYYLGEGEEVYHDDGLLERLPQILHRCIGPSLLQVLQYVAPMLLLCLLCRLLCQLYARRGRLSQSSLRTAPLHLIHLGCGLTLLHFSVGFRLWLLLLLAAVGYLLLQLLRLGRRGAQLLALLTIGSQFLYELLIWRKRSDWPQMRGIQMVVNMKLISLGFDLTGGGGGQLAACIPNPLAYLGYIYSPATCALGPWVSYGSYSNCLVPRSCWLLSLRRTLANVGLCLLTVSVSNCLAPVLSELASGQWHFLAMYTDALSVRSSHYFVGFIAQALLVVTDQRLDGSQESELLGPLVAQPWRIEWPRSISTLVRSWNIPMHEWLKRYIYTPCKTTGRQSRMHTLLAVFCTYVVSSLLHGMDLRIYLVLISLAVLAAGESLLRRHLSNIFDACLAANHCPGAERCRYSNCTSKQRSIVRGWLVRLANLSFTALAIFHLAYLGVVLLGDTLETGAASGTAEEEGFLWHWKQAGYLSHYIGVGTIVLYLFIS